VHIDKILDFLEKQMSNEDYPKTLREDIEWSIEMIRGNKLYSELTDKTIFDKNRQEVKAWIDIISLNNVKTTLEEMQRLKEFEDFHNSKKQKKDLKKDKS
jgi:hypothetical protein